MPVSQYLIPELIERGAPRPIYLQLYEQLKRELVLGGHAAGERFFSYRKLHEIYHAELRTIAAAVDLLVKDGLLERRMTSGIFVAPQTKVSDVGNIWYAVMDEQCYHPFFFNILIGLVKEAELYGLRIIVRFGKNREEFFRWFLPRPGEGLVVTGLLDADFLAKASDRCNGNLVVVGNYDLVEQYARVVTDNLAKLREALQRAYAYGCRRFGLVTGLAQTRLVRDMRDVLTDFAADCKVFSKAVAEAGENGQKAMERLADFHPDCVLLTEPAFGGALEFLMAHGLKCPEDVFLIRYGKEASDRSFRNAAAIDVQNDAENHGRTAVQMLLKSSHECRTIGMELVAHYRGRRKCQTL
ncbi:MAG: GntR family transcriptional regulator [Victivallales bacterium]|nr:GntR family transcriptional regulator [Victivallales bacterium]